jgi:hypothetical protein
LQAAEGTTRGASHFATRDPAKAASCKHSADSGESSLKRAVIHSDLFVASGRPGRPARKAVNLEREGKLRFGSCQDPALSFLDGCVKRSIACSLQALCNWASGNPSNGLCVRAIGADRRLRTLGGVRINTSAIHFSTDILNRFGFCEQF